MRSEPLALHAVPKNQSVPRIRHAVGISVLAARRKRIVDRSSTQFSRPCQATILHGLQLLRAILVILLCSEASRLMCVPGVRGNAFPTGPAPSGPG